MRQRLINFVKTHSVVRKCYEMVGSLLIRCLGVFFPIHSKRMIFVCYGGKKFDDSPRVLYEEICKRRSFDNWELIWAFVNTDEWEIDRGKMIKIDTLKYFITIMSSKVWITNSAVDRGLNIKKKGTIEVNTWHGAPLKKICGEEHDNYLKKSAANKGKKKLDTAIRCAQSEFDRAVFQRVFHASRDCILVCDLPRNDELCNFVYEDKEGLKKILNIPVDKKVILYTPTYREYLRDSRNNCYITPPMNLSKWEKELGLEYILLIRAHYEITKCLNIQESNFIRDMSNYKKLNDLYIIADIMISDYSSTFFDYSILERPMLCFAYDIEEYVKKRGLYLNLEEVLPCPVDRDEDTLIRRIKTLSYSDYSEKTKKFKNTYVPYAGHAAGKVVDKLESVL